MPILIAEDNPTYQWVVQLMLPKLGYFADAAAEDRHGIR